MNDNYSITHEYFHEKIISKVSVSSHLNQDIFSGEPPSKRTIFPSSFSHLTHQSQLRTKLPLLSPSLKALVNTTRSVIGKDDRKPLLPSLVYDRICDLVIHGPDSAIYEATGWLARATTLRKVP